MGRQPVRWQHLVGGLLFFAADSAGSAAHSRGLAFLGVHTCGVRILLERRGEEGAAILL